MKKLLKTVIITVIILGALTAGGIFLLTKSDDEVGEFGTRRHLQQSDQEDEHAFRYDTEQLATPLVREGEGKNVLNFDDYNVFSVGHSKDCRDRLDRLIRRSSPDFEKPIIAYNPFGTMENSYYFYFKTQSKYMVKYTVTVADEKVPDRIRYVNNGQVKNVSTEHEFVVGGLIPGMTNYIILELLDENGGHRDEIIYKADVPEASLPHKVSYERGKSDFRLQNGMFFMLPKDDKRIYTYDNNGYIRGIINTESGHGRRVFTTDSNLVYQTAGTHVAKINRIGQIEGMALFTGITDILDFSYDGYDNVYALVKEKKQYKIVCSSTAGGRTKDVFTFPKGIKVTSIVSVTGSKLYASTSSPMGIMRIDGLMSADPRVGLVFGITSDWVTTPYKKKIVDPTAPKKEKKKDDDKDKKKDNKDESSGEDESEDSEEAEAASGEAVLVAPEEKKDPPLAGWDMKDSVLSLVADESAGKTDVLTFCVEKGRLIHAVKLQIDGKKKEAKVLLDKETEFDGQVFMQWYDHGYSIIANGTRGTYEERDADFRVTRTFDFGREFDGLWKYSLEGMFFFG